MTSADKILKELQHEQRFLNEVLNIPTFEWLHREMENSRYLTEIIYSLINSYKKELYIYKEKVGAIEHKVRELEGRFNRKQGKKIDLE